MCAGGKSGAKQQLQPVKSRRAALGTLTSDILTSPHYAFSQRRKHHTSVGCQATDGFRDHIRTWLCPNKLFLPIAMCYGPRVSSRSAYPRCESTHATILEVQAVKTSPSRILNPSCMFQAIATAPRIPSIRSQRGSRPALIHNGERAATHIECVCLHATMRNLTSLKRALARFVVQFLTIGFVELLSNFLPLCVSFTATHSLLLYRILFFRSLSSRAGRGLTSTKRRTFFLLRELF